jgi:hypothetical protein
MLQRLNRLTQDEPRTTAVQILEVVYCLVTCETFIATIHRRCACSYLNLGFVGLSVSSRSFAIALKGVSGKS